MNPKTTYHLRTWKNDEGQITKLAVARNEHGLWTTIREVTSPADKRPTIEAATAFAIQVAEEDRVNRGVKPDSVRLTLAERAGDLLTSRRATPKTTTAAVSLDGKGVARTTAATGTEKDGDDGNATSPVAASA